MGMFDNQIVEFYDSSALVAKPLLQEKPQKLTLYTRNKDQDTNTPNFVVSPYSSPSSATISNADFCFLDGTALRVLAVRYPSDAGCILARIRLTTSIFIGFSGLLRRLLLGRVKLGGILILKNNKNKRTFWLVVNRTKKTITNEPLFLPKEVGVTALFEWLNQHHIRYVVPRFYEKLPKLHRDGGDLDFLVADEDVATVITHIRSHSDKLSKSISNKIPIGMHSVSMGKGVPYYPPHLANRMLDNAIDGPAGSRVPEPTDALNSLIYHALYHHKGYATGIKSILNDNQEQPPDNDYGAIIQRKAAALDIDVGRTMEELDEYMNEIGWRPKPDTLAKISEKNLWVFDRFIKGQDQHVMGLSVFILKERALERDLLWSITDAFKKDGLKIVKVVVLSEQEKVRAEKHIRGGHWADPTGSVNGLLPAATIITLDPKCAHLPPFYAREFERIQVSQRKKKIRDMFDRENEPSLIHSSDNTNEAQDYIETCFPHIAKQIDLDIKAMLPSSLTSFLQNYFLISYVKHALRFGFRDFITKKLF